MSPTPLPPSSSSFEGDFAPGEVLIGRYRIVALIGEGGMGQVYLADDLILGQSVAVKFLPQHIAEREGGLERFVAEVRLAREVTHPNVARVHDIGEVDGRRFLTMEFVDGEDLASLLRRIGRLPQEKLTEMAQQICSGLAEAHRRGVLHRDLKPANVMLDGEGRVRLTDFGLAVVAGDETSMGGTPQYMAPEQLAGVAASARTEIYSLGLLLYELYTGRRALRGRTLEELRLEHEQGGPASATTHFEALDPQVEAVLARCLARDPLERPASVDEVARALPGGDPLAAALAAGKTPEPHLVAEARPEGSLSRRRAGQLVALAVVVLFGLVGARTWTMDALGLSYGRPAAFQRERARDLALELAGREAFASEVHWYNVDASLGAVGAALSGWLPEGFELPASLVHHSRFSMGSLEPAGAGVVSADPAPAPGDVHVVLDLEGRLLRWQMWPDEREGGGGADGPPDPVRLLEAAGRDLTGLTPVEPEGVLPMASDHRQAWAVALAPGAHEGAAAPEPLRLELASLGGRPVSLELQHGGEALGSGVLPMQSPLALTLIELLLVAGAGVLAWRNLRRGSADLRGSLVVALFLVATHLAYQFALPLPLNAGGLSAVGRTGVDYAVMTGVRIALMYLAVEPLARRQAPRVLIGWSRLLEGRFLDPIVGREVLAGVAGALGVTLAWAVGMAATWGLAPALFEAQATGVLPILGLEGPLVALAHIAHLSGDAVLFGGMLVILLVVIKRVVRIPVLPELLWLALFLGVLGTGPGYGLIGALLLGVLLLIHRVGFLAVVVMMLSMVLLTAFVTSLRPTDWAFASGLPVLLANALLLAWGYRAILAGEPDERATSD